MWERFARDSKVKRLSDACRARSRDLTAYYAQIFGVAVSTDIRNPFARLSWCFFRNSRSRRSNLVGSSFTARMKRAIRIRIGKRHSRYVVLVKVANRAAQ